MQLDADTCGAVLALIAQSEENIWLATVPVETQHSAITLCNLVWFPFLADMIELEHSTQQLLLFHALYKKTSVLILKANIIVSKIHYCKYVSVDISCIL